MVISEIQMNMEPIKREDKQIIYSKIVNEPKMKHIKHILKYNLDHW